MIVQHTDKECKTKFSTGVEFKNSLYDNVKFGIVLFVFGHMYGIIVSIKYSVKY